MFWSSTMQACLPVFGVVTLFCPGLYLSSFFIKVTVIDFVYNTQNVRNRVISFGHPWFSEVHLVSGFVTSVIQRADLYPQMFTEPEMVRRFFHNLSWSQLVTEVMMRIDGEHNVDFVYTNDLMSRVGMMRAFRAFRLERYVLDCGDDAWFLPVVAARECTANDLLTILEIKDVGLVETRAFIQHRFPSVLGPRGLREALEECREYATVCEILTFITQEYLENPNILTDNDVLHFLLHFISFLTYDVRLQFLSLYQAGDPAVWDILWVHFRNLNAIGQQLFAAEVFRTILVTRPEWSNLSLGCFQGLRLLEDMRPSAEAARIAGGET
jgi:hypothetical protein